MLSLLGKVRAAHARTGAPGDVVDVSHNVTRYVVDVPRPGRHAKRLTYRLEFKSGDRVTVKPCWTEHSPDGKAIQHRRSATE